MKKLIILNILSIIMFSPIFAKNYDNYDFSEDIKRIEQISRRGGDGTVKELIEYWKQSKDIVKYIKEKENKGDPVSFDFNRNFQNFNSSLRSELINKAYKYPEIRNLYLEEFKEHGGKLSADLYLRNSKDYADTVVELYNLRKDSVYSLIELYLRKGGTPKDTPPKEKTLRMTDGIFSMVSDYFNSEVSKQNSSIFGRLLLESKNYKFDMHSMSESEYQAKALELVIRNAIARTSSRDFSKFPKYFFGIDDRINIVMTASFHEWTGIHLEIIKMEGFSLENLKKIDAKDDLFLRAYILSLRASLGDTSVKTELQKDLLALEDPTVIAFLLDLYSSIATKEDSNFLNELKSKDIVCKMDENSLNFHKEYAERMKKLGKEYVKNYREEISPITEAVERILKKIESDN